MESRRMEEQREDQARQVTRDMQMQANLKSEERFERKRQLRKMQDEEYERQIEEAYVQVKKPTYYQLAVCFFSPIEVI